jgi:hypothetical protein
MSMPRKAEFLRRWREDQHATVVNFAQCLTVTLPVYAAAQQTVSSAVTTLVTTAVRCSATVSAEEAQKAL